tara:strand:- start:1221 stop:1850 length:630 start_codon:yes stop_codon:yes gene_type:complete
MYVSLDRKFIFFHVPKTGGTSIKAALRPHCLDTGSPEGLFQVHLDVNTMSTRIHKTVWDEYYKFAFVRNPWDLAVSYYHYVREHHAHVYHDTVMEYRDFPEYVEQAMWHRGLPETVVIQHRFTMSEQRDGINFVGRYETLQKDFERVCSSIGLCPIRLPVKNKSELKTNHYSAYYTSEAREQVFNLCYEDISTFGYTFEEPSSSTPEQD